MTVRGNASDLTIIFLIDALGWDIARKHDFCGALLPCSGPLDTVLGYSSAAIPSLLSGTPPAVHGAWAMYKYRPESSPFKFLRFIPSLPHPLEWRLRALTRWITEKRKVIRGYYELYDIPLNVLGYFDVAHHGDPYAPGGLKEESFFDRLVRDGVPYRSWTYRTPEAENLEALRDAIDSPSRVLFLYTAELDALMHRVGTSHGDVARKLGDYERWVGLLLERAAGAGRNATLFLFSDHGMTDVDTVVDLRAEVRKWGYRMGRDFLAFYDSTMARFWCNPAVRRDLAKKLEDTGWGKVLSNEELDALGCRFADDSYGELIFLVRPGHLIVPSYMGRERVAAMHGYHPADPSSRGSFFSNDSKGALPGSILDLKALLLAHLGGGR
jgi:predicted AlkP superfamily pyrophosphatase or phosphodiesterase